MLSSSVDQSAAVAGGGGGGGGAADGDGCPPPRTCSRRRAAGAPSVSREQGQRLVKAPVFVLSAPRDHFIDPSDVAACGPGPDVSRETARSRSAWRLVGNVGHGTSRAHLGLNSHDGAHRRWSCARSDRRPPQIPGAESGVPIRAAVRAELVRMFGAAPSCIDRGSPTPPARSWSPPRRTGYGDGRTCARAVPGRKPASTSR